MTEIRFRRPEAALALAVVASSKTPLVLLDDQLLITAASTAFYEAFQIDPLSGPDRPLFVIGAGDWDVPQLRSLLKTTLSGQAQISAYEMELRRQGRGTRQLSLSAEKLDYGDPDNVRLLLSVSDVTDTRAANKLRDDLLQEKANLLQEVQHRIANSLQIIASVLMQTALWVQSEETRGHLQDAHNRVLSVAAVQRRLATSRLGDVALRTYLTELCQSLGASMIYDPE